MGVVNETVQDGVGIGRIADYFVPSVYWKLGGNHRGAASVAFLEDFEKIVPCGGVKRLQAPVIENEQIGTSEIAQQTRMASVTPRQGKGFEEPGYALIDDRAVVTTRLVAERRSQPALADAGRSSVHNAGCPAFEVRIFYPFHPRAGHMVQVEHRKRLAGEDHLLVVQPDDTLALIPAWMSEETVRLHGNHRLPLFIHR